MKKGILKLLILWILVCGASWLIVVFYLFRVQYEHFRSWDSVFAVSVEFILPCFLLGIFTAVLQFLVLRIRYEVTWHWILLTTLGYTLIPVFSVIAIVTVLWVAYPETLTTNGLSFISMPNFLSMILNGLLIGLVQWPLIRKMIPETRKREFWLWVLISAFAWGLAFLLGKFSFDLRIQSMITGITIGAVSGIFFVIVENTIPKKNRFKRKIS